MMCVGRMMTKKELKRAIMMHTIWGEFLVVNDGLSIDNLNICKEYWNKMLSWPEWAIDKLDSIWDYYENQLE